MINAKNKLQPLAHMKPLNSSASVEAKLTATKKKAPQQKSEQIDQRYKSVKYTRSAKRPTTAIELYDCGDMEEMGGLEDDGYFERQLEKNIKTEVNPKKATVPIPKSQILLPKLEGESTIKQMKDLEKEMDLEMSRIQDDEM